MIQPPAKSNRQFIANLIYSTTCIKISSEKIIKSGGRWIVYDGSRYTSVSDIIKRNFVKAENRFHSFTITPVGSVGFRGTCICIFGTDIVTFRPKFRFVIVDLNGRVIRKYPVVYSTIADSFFKELIRIDDIRYPAVYITSPNIEKDIVKYPSYSVSSRLHNDIVNNPIKFLK